jgi:hypothetical protein
LELGRRSDLVDEKSEWRIAARVVGLFLYAKESAARRLSQDLIRAIAGAGSIDGFADFL